MAYSDDIKILRAARTAARELQSASHWPSGDVFSVEKSVIYELYCLSRLLRNLSRHQDIQYVPGSGPGENKFPKAPAKKKGRPRFVVRKNGRTFCQICIGTGIKDPHGHERHPDISFQKPDSPEAPNVNHILMIWDAKYRKSLDSRLAQEEVAVFSSWISLFGIGDASLPIKLEKLRSLNSNILLTNGRPSTELDARLRRDGMKECTSFAPGSRFLVRPKK